ncbi:MAG: HIT family hydrolase [Ignavibacteriae bacterium HGW-Ignavibacteriae-3]|nr:MAG: HIT family hydrolase [Ignavibacteriae bacterium HGW-Ignavibacteriae-3]
MEKLWSPWRSNYIDSFKTRKDSDECVFCEAPKKEIRSQESLVVCKNDLCYVMLNLYPYNSGHLMIIPYRHQSDMSALSQDEMTEMMEMVQLSIKALDLTMNPQGFNFGANLGKAAGAGIDTHLHFHIVPRWSGDINFMPAIGEVKIISQDLLVTKNNLINAFDHLLKK